MELRIVWLKFRGAAQVFGGLARSPTSHCKYAQIKMDFGVARIHGQRALVTLYCFGGASEAVERICHGDERICKVGLDGNGQLVVTQRTLEFSCAIMQVAQIKVRCCILWVAGYGEMVRAASLIQLGSREQ